MPKPLRVTIVPSPAISNTSAIAYPLPPPASAIASRTLTRCALGRKRAVAWQGAGRVMAVRVRQLAVLVLIVPLTPFGKKPPFIADSLVRYTMSSTWPGVRLNTMPLLSVGTRFAVPSDAGWMP